MQLIMDGLLVAAAMFAGTYCLVLGRRVKALKDLDSGLGGAITQMTRALEDARRALEEAKTTSRDGRQDVKELVTRAEAAAGHLRILLAATRDLTPADVERHRSPRPAPEPAAAERPVAEARVEPAAVARPEPPVRRARPASEPERAAPAEAELSPLPKPRKLFPLETLRPRPRPAAPPEAPRGEDDLLAALSALAAPQQG